MKPTMSHNGTHVRQGMSLRDAAVVNFWELPRQFFHAEAQEGHNVEPNRAFDLDEQFPRKVSMVYTKLLPLLILTGPPKGSIPWAKAQASDSVALLASSPFRMILQPTATELEFDALRFLEDATPSVLLAQQPQDQPFVDMEMVVQQVDFVEAQNVTRIRFFVLATTSATDEASSSPTSQSDLNDFIEITLSDGTDILSMLQASGIPILQAVQVVVVQEIAPTTPTTPDSTPSPPKKISTLDIVLIVVSGAIFLGIAYMVIQHIKDRGYIENQRLLALNSSPAPTPTNQSNGPNQAEESPGREHKQATESENAPNTPSTTNSVADADVDEDEEAAAPGTPERRPVRITSVAPVQPQDLPVTDPLPTSEPGKESPEKLKIPEEFEKNWFHEDRSKASSTKTVEDMERAHSSIASDSESSEDVFHIDVDALCADESRSKASSSSSAITEWMKTIRVVPTHSTNKTDGTHSTLGSQEKSSEGESSGPTVDQSSDELSSLECVSLEQSLQSSTTGEKTAEASKGEV